jgi:thioredoxin reductase
MLDVAIIGAGPYGLSIAAHLRERGLQFRIYGKLMDSWLSHMPKGMLLKSDGFASNLYDPGSRFTLKQFCTEQGIPYADTGVPVKLDTFTSYGLAFQQRMLSSEFQDSMVTGVEQLPNGFTLLLDNGETVLCRRLVLAVGITHFEYVPPMLAHLPGQYLSHSARHRDLEGLRGRSVAIVGAGASALDLAGLLHEAGADVQLISRRKELVFHTAPNGKRRSLWKRIRHPQSGLGPGLRSRFYSDAPQAFHRLPERWRLAIVGKALGPSGGWFIRDMVIGRVPALLGYFPEAAAARDGCVHLQLRSVDGDCTKAMQVEHVIAATGYRVDLARLRFLSKDLQGRIRCVQNAPVLSPDFESSLPGLYFAGVAAANSFGPVMRFAYGAGFTARRLAGVLQQEITKNVAVRVGRLAQSAE